MIIPTRSQCLDLIEQVRMPEHIKKHSLVVARIAVYLGGLLNHNSLRLNLELLEAGALLHDIAKARSLSTGERHEDVGARMLEDWGYALLSFIVREHVMLDVSVLHGPITESLLVNYSDKRVKHDHVVSLNDRFSDLISRYARTKEHRAWLQEKFSLYMLLESKIFEHLTITPDDLSRLNLSQAEHLDNADPDPGTSPASVEEGGIIFLGAKRWG
jgi:uncharacterized protein